MSVPVSIDGKSILTLYYKNLHDLNIRSQSYENSENLDVGVI
jgi:hypothetical protein